MPYFTFQCIVEINEKKYCSLLILFFFEKNLCNTNRGAVVEMPVYTSSWNSLVQFLSLWNGQQTWADCSKLWISPLTFKCHCCSNTELLGLQVACYEMKMNFAPRFFYPTCNTIWLHPTSFSFFPILEWSLERSRKTSGYLYKFLCDHAILILETYQKALPWSFILSFSSHDLFFPGNLGCKLFFPLKLFL